MLKEAAREFEVFKHELLLAPRQVRVRLLERLEEAALDVVPGKSYPFDYLVYRVTDHRPEETTPVVLSAEDAAAGLADVLYEVGRSVPVAAESLPEGVLGVEELARRWGVSPATVLRWRAEGLAMRLLRLDSGRRKAAVRESLVSHFEQTRTRLIRRARSRRRLSADEKRAIVEEALIGLSREEQPPSVLSRLSRRFVVSEAAIERVLLSAARTNDSLRPCTRSRMAGSRGQALYGEFLAGSSVEDISARHSMSLDKVARLLLRARAKRLTRRPLKVIRSGEFVGPSARATILGSPMEPPKKTSQPETVPVYLKGVADPSLLTKEEEVELFRRYNYLKFLASQIITAIDVRRPSETAVSTAESLIADAMRVRDRIITANLRLVPAIARKHTVPTGSFQSIISEGNMALLDAVESFDYTRGNRFSTYAGWAITRRFARALPEERSRVAIVEDEILDAVARVEVDFSAARPAAIIAGIKRALQSLSERDRVVLERRFGIGANATPATLAELGAIFGVTKERVRQVEAQALVRLRRIVEKTAPELAPA